MRGHYMAQETTLVLIKPDATAAHHIGDIIRRYEKESLTVVAMRMMKMTNSLAAKHYVEHVGRPYYEELVDFMTSAPLVALVLQGEDAIARVRAINGKTNPAEADEGTIRKLYASSGGKNAVHASDSPASAAREIALFFAAAEVYDEV